MNGVSKISVANDVVSVTFVDIIPHIDKLNEIFEVLKNNEVNIDMVSLATPASGRTNISFTTAGDEFLILLKIIAELKTKNPELTPMISTGNSKITLFGEEMKNSSGVIAAAVDALNKINIDISMITTSETDFSFLLPASSFEAAHEVLKQIFGDD